MLSANEIRSLRFPFISMKEPGGDAERQRSTFARKIRHFKESDTSADDMLSSLDADWNPSIASVQHRPLCVVYIGKYAFMHLIPNG